MTLIKTMFARVSKEAGFRLLGSSLSIGLISMTMAQAASSQRYGPKSEPIMCSRLKDLTTEFPNAQADRLLSKHSSEERCRQYFWHALKIKTRHEILSDAEIYVYEAAIARRDCQEAATLLHKRFAEAHPLAQFILTDEKEASFWKEIVVGNHFHDLYLCRVVADLAKAQRDIDSSGVVFGPYRGDTFDLGDRQNIGKRNGVFDPKVEARDKAVVKLMDINFSGKRSVYSRALLELSHVGVALELHPLWELFLSFRLRDAGVQDPLVASILSRPVDPQIRAEIEEHAKDKLTGWNQIPVHPERTYPKKSSPD